MLRHLENVGSPNLKLDEFGDNTASITETDPAKEKFKRFGLPLRMFGEGAFFQPYVPLQQMDVITSPTTKSFLVGTSNAIFIHHRACAMDVVAHADTGALEILNPALNQVLNLTAADRKFMDDIVKSVSSTYRPEDDMSMNQQIDFEGSDDDIRSRFEGYLVSLLASANAAEQAIIAPADSPLRGKDFLGDYNLAWVKAWQSTNNYRNWINKTGVDLREAIPAHPCQGTSMIGALQTSIAARFSELGRSLTPIQANLGKAAEKAVVAAETSIVKAVDAVTDPENQQKVQGRPLEPEKACERLSFLIVRFHPSSNSAFTEHPCSKRYAVIDER
ncbi:late secretory pathway protein avl9 [Borealophlyctis nickersoniae]|nr:late secretory pathway protein avl9 [Borealophlyctis nickersoniae]